jgi:hypothetical protein
MNWLERAYCFVWYYFEFWVDKYARRPFTYCMRDFVHRYPIIGVALILALGTVFAYLVYLNILWMLLSAFYWLLVGHVTWSDYTPNEQEDPPVIDP